LTKHRRVSAPRFVREQNAADKKAGQFLKLGRKRHAEWIANERDYFPDYGTPGEPGLKRNAPGVPSNLTKYRYRGPKYTAAEEADELRRIRAGDKQALERFAKHFQPKIRKILGVQRENYRGLSKTEIARRIRSKKVYYSLSEEERIAVGNLGLARFIAEYDITRNVRLAAGLESYVRGAFLDWIKGTTKADRALFAHPQVRTAAELVKFAGYSTASPVKLAKALERAEDALLKRDAAKKMVRYDGGAELEVLEEPDGTDQRVREIDPRHFIGQIDPFENQRVHQHAAIGSVIELAVAISGGRAKQIIKQYGLRAYAQMRVAEKASITWTEIKQIGRASCRERV